MKVEDSALQHDIDKISKIAIVPQLLDVICRTTGMGFSAIARVTEDKWIACQVKDDIAFGLEPGGELEIETTICNEIRQSGNAVVIDHVSDDPDFAHHHTPAMYGFQSYISVPIFRKDKTFFGTLCAIDPHPRKLNNPQITGMFTLFADLISFHLEAVDQLDTSRNDLLIERGFNAELEDRIRERTDQLEQKNEMLLKTNQELQEFNYISSHDLQEPLRKIQTFVSRLQQSESDGLSDKGVHYLRKISQSAERMRLLIDDLLSYSQTDRERIPSEMTDLGPIVTEVLDDLHEQIAEKSVEVEVGQMCSANVIPFQMSQLFYNIIGNSVKYASDQRRPKIIVQAGIVENGSLVNPTLTANRYCHISISDNGIGFDPRYNEKIFGLFQRLHGKQEYSGTGVGLAIVKKIVEIHNGMVFASGNEDHGAKFDVFLPVGSTL
ncbi:GAF domain-containing sensor histidine kinase [Flavobacterium selenitireducens]|uniref:GAF domain-containing sensor histidine kinase n=1 Tax=Flavobacterium selenitireducens TaxID=2722704 RepID=UPI00168BE976|nr:ATP-binding protein [Flavobacterium selenitireducens]MBD3583178.1 GAF domain-containing protein [Flavobacterium selenitireducens]